MNTSDRASSTQWYVNVPIAWGPFGRANRNTGLMMGSTTESAITRMPTPIAIPAIVGFDGTPASAVLCTSQITNNSLLST